MAMVQYHSARITPSALWRAEQVPAAAMLLQTSRALPVTSTSLLTLCHPHGRCRSCCPCGHRGRESPVGRGEAAAQGILVTGGDGEQRQLHMVGAMTAQGEGENVRGKRKPALPPGSSFFNSSWSQALLGAGQAEPGSSGLGLWFL